MTIGVQLDLSGFRRLAAGEAAAIDRGVKRAAEFVADLAQQLAPEQTGALKASVRVRPGPEPGVYLVTFGGGDTGVDYATFVEYGTHASPAQPYLTPALREIDVAKEIAEELKALL